MYGNTVSGIVRALSAISTELNVLFLGYENVLNFDDAVICN